MENTFDGFNIKIDPAPEKRHLFRIKLNIPYSRDELLEEFEKEDWKPFGADSEVDINHWPGKRFKVLWPREENRKLWELQNYFSSDELKRLVIDAMYERMPEFPTWWGWQPEGMFNHCMIHGELTKDLPGFVNDIHTDYRRLVATGLIYWAEGDDPNLSSFFYDDLQRTNPVRITTNYGDGWWHANSNNSWHDGINNTDKIRYSTLLGLTVNVAALEGRPGNPPPYVATVQPTDD